MANTTDMIITCADEDLIIERLSHKTGIDFKKVSDAERCGGSKIVFFESYAACYRSLGAEKIQEIINEFRLSDFSFPQLAVLIIDDDDDNFNGVVLRQS